MIFYYFMFRYCRPADIDSKICIDSNTLALDLEG